MQIRIRHHAKPQRRMSMAPRYVLLAILQSRRHIPQSTFRATPSILNIELYYTYHTFSCKLLSSPSYPIPPTDPTTPGHLDPDHDSDFWADHDEDCHGVIEDLRDELPEGFVWDCCDAKGDEEGCEVGVHVPDLGRRVRART